MTGLPAIGTQVRYIGQHSTPRSEGVVVRHGKGYSAHACTNHSFSPDCICGGDKDGRVEAMPDWAVVDWGVGESCIDTADEGEMWEVA